MEYPNDTVSYSSGAGGWGSERFLLVENRQQKADCDACSMR